MMTLTRHFDSFTEARNNLRSVLDAAAEGLVTTVDRKDERFVVAPADACGEELRRLLPSNAVVVAEGGGWAALVPGVPVHGDADNFAEAIDDLIAGLREYAKDWNDRLHAAPNHAQPPHPTERVRLRPNEGRHQPAWGHTGRPVSRRGCPTALSRKGCGRPGDRRGRRVGL